MITRETGKRQGHCEVHLEITLLDNLKRIHSYLKRIAREVLSAEAKG